MRKTECIHLHALGVCLREELEESDDVAADHFEAYDDLDVSPCLIHRDKSAHRAAATALIDGAAAAVEAEPPTPGGIAD